MRAGRPEEVRRGADFWGAGGGRRPIAMVRRAPDVYAPEVARRSPISTVRRALTTTRGEAARRL